MRPRSGKCRYECSGSNGCSLTIAQLNSKAFEAEECNDIPMIDEQGPHTYRGSMKTSSGKGKAAKSTAGVRVLKIHLP